MASLPFHHRSNFGAKRKAHKVPGKSKPSSDSQSFGRVDSNMKERKFQCNELEHSKAQRKATAKLKRKAHRDQLLATKCRSDFIWRSHSFERIDIDEFSIWLYERRHLWNI